MTDHERWQKYFLCERIPEDIDAEGLELIYQAFKARLIAEVVADSLVSPVEGIAEDGEKVTFMNQYCRLADIGEQTE